MLFSKPFTQANTWPEKITQRLILWLSRAYCIYCTVHLFSPLNHIHPCGAAQRNKPPLISPSSYHWCCHRSCYPIGTALGVVLWCCFAPLWSLLLFGHSLRRENSGDADASCFSLGLNHNNNPHPSTGSRWCCSASVHCLLPSRKSKRSFPLAELSLSSQGNKSGSVLHYISEI